MFLPPFSASPTRGIREILFDFFQLSNLPLLNDAAIIRPLSPLIIFGLSPLEPSKSFRLLTNFFALASQRRPLGLLATPNDLLSSAPRSSAADLAASAKEAPPPPPC